MDEPPDYYGQALIECKAAGYTDVERMAALMAQISEAISDEVKRHAPLQSPGVRAAINKAISDFLGPLKNQGYIYPRDIP